MTRSFIKKKWTFWIRILLSPIAWLGFAFSLPVILLLALSDFDKAAAITDFWTTPQ